MFKYREGCVAATVATQRSVSSQIYLDRVIRLRFSRLGVLFRRLSLQLLTLALGIDLYEKGRERERERDREREREKERERERERERLQH